MVPERVRADPLLGPRPGQAPVQLELLGQGREVCGGVRSDLGFDTKEEAIAG